MLSVRSQTLIPFISNTINAKKYWALYPHNMLPCSIVSETVYKYEDMILVVLVQAGI